MRPDVSFRSASRSTLNTSWVYRNQPRQCTVREMPLKSISVSNFRCFRELNIPPDGTQLSPGINLFIGPNGSGKTSLFNLIRLTVGREPLNSQMEFMVGSTRVGTSSWVHDFNQPDKPWSAKATFELNDGNAELLVASSDVLKLIRRHGGGA